MYISAINNFFYPNKINNSKKNRPISFGVNLNSPVLNYRPCDFFIKIKGYGKSYVWANKVIKTADSAVKQIRENETFDNILKTIADGIKKANSTAHEKWKKSHSGILRTERKGWKNEAQWHTIWTKYDGYGNEKYHTYYSRFEKTRTNKLKNPIPTIQLTIPFKDEEGHFLLHAEPEYVNNALDYIKTKFEYLRKNYIKKEVKQEDLEDINNSIAEIRWVFAHATPFERGSDAIGNIFMKSLYKAIGIKSSSPKSNISFDLEAYCTPLEEYKKNFCRYFLKEPKIID